MSIRARRMARTRDLPLTDQERRSLAQRIEERPIYPRPATVRLALEATSDPRADMDVLGRPGSAAHARWCRRVDQIETVLEFVSRVPVGRAY